MAGQYSTELRHFVWDFNGTLLDDLGITVDSINSVLRARKCPEVTKRKHREEFRFPVEDYYRDLGLEFRSESFAAISREYHELYMQRIHECELHDGVSELILYLHKRGVTQYILSAMHEPLLLECLRTLNMEDAFEAVYGLGDMHGRSKVDRGRQLLKDFDLEPQASALLGDTEHDMEVARALGMLPVAAGWGHQSAGMFDANGTILALQPSDVIDALREQSVLVA